MCIPHVHWGTIRWSTTIAFFSLDNLIQSTLKVPCSQHCCNLSARFLRHLCPARLLLWSDSILYPSPGTKSNWCDVGFAVYTNVIASNSRLIFESGVVCCPGAVYQDGEYRRANFESLLPFFFGWIVVFPLRARHPSLEYYRWDRKRSWWTEQLLYSHCCTSCSCPGKMMHQSLAALTTEVRPWWCWIALSMLWLSEVWQLVHTHRRSYIGSCTTQWFMEVE